MFYLFSDSSNRGTSKQYPLTVLLESPISCRPCRLVRPCSFQAAPGLTTTMQVCCERVGAGFVLFPQLQQTFRSVNACGLFRETRLSPPVRVRWRLSTPGPQHMPQRGPEPQKSEPCSANPTRLRKQLQKSTSELIRKLASKAAKT